MLLPWELSSDAYEYINTFPEDQREMVYKSYVLFMLDSYKVSSLCGYVILGAFAGIIVLVGLARFFNWAWQAALPEHHRINLPWFNLYRNYVLEAPLLRQKRAQAHEWFHGSLIVRAPGRIHTLALIALTMTNLVCCFAFYHTLPDNLRSADLLGGSLWVQHLRSFSDRAALLALAQLALTFAFSGRNSIVVWITGCNFNTLMLYHRWLARFTTALTLAHAVGYTLTYSWYKIYTQYFKVDWWNWGITGLTMWFCCCFFSYTAFRRWSYEIFILTHIIFVVWSLAAVWRHVVTIESTTNTPFMVYVWLSIGLWMFDRLVRIVRVAVLSVDILALFRGKFNTTKVTVKTLPDGLLLARIRPAGCSSGLLAVQPGQHIYINIPRVQMLSMHPFTVLANGNDHHADGTSSKWIDVGIQPVQGFSRLLAKRNAPNNATLTAFLEGPYGRAVHTKGYPSCVLLAAGIGVTHTLGVLLEVCKSVNYSEPPTTGDEESKVAPTKQSVDFVWVLRSPSGLLLAMPYLVHASQQMRQLSSNRSVEVRIRIFISGQDKMTATRSDNNLSADMSTVPQLSQLPGLEVLGTSSGHDTPEKPPLATASPSFVKEDDLAKSSSLNFVKNASMSDGDDFEKRIDRFLRTQDPSVHFADGVETVRRAMSLTFHLGRPCIGDELALALTSSLSPTTQGKGKILVTSCGPAQFSDEVRSSIRTIRSTRVGIDFDEEVFAW